MGERGDVSIAGHTIIINMHYQPHLILMILESSEL